MLNDTDILQYLNQVLNEEDLSSAIHRILYVPEAWREIHNNEFLTLALEKIDRAGWSPATLASLAIGQSSLSSALDDLSSEQESRIANLMDLNVDAESKNLVDIALLSVTLLRIAADEGLDGLTEAIFKSTDFWAPAVCCAWPYLEFGQEIIDALIREGSQAAIGLVTQILHSNMDVPSAVEILSDLDPTLIRKVLINLNTMHEDELFLALSESVNEELNPIPANNQQDPGGLSEQAIILAAAGNAAGAQEIVSQAWDRTTLTSALVADRLADIARMDDDPVLEVEARKQALQLKLTPRRRAELAKAYVQIDRPQDALDLLVEPATAEEFIAAGQAYELSNESALAADYFIQAYQQSLSAPALDPTWMAMLSSGLDASGKYREAVRVLEILSVQKPVDAELRHNLATLLEKAGDPNAAAEQASFALTLLPKSLELRETLARNLQKSGHSEQAIPHWQTITLQDKQALARLSACALEAGDYTLAKESAEELRLDNPESVEAQVLLGKALSALGEHQEAETHLKKVTQLTPSDAEAWIALAECQMATGDEDTANETLNSALQALPANGAVHIAKAHWLRENSMQTEALEHIRQAVELDPERADWLVDYGDLLRELGRAEEATPILQSALEKQPENWKARQALALTFESQGEMASAAALIKRLPTNLDSESLWNAGRILVQTPSAQEETAHEVGVETLEMAREAGFDDNAIDYWIAHGLRRQDLNEEAINHYQSFLDNSEDLPSEAHLQGVLGLADAAIAMDDAMLAIATMEKHRGQYPTSLEMLILLAKAHMSLNDFGAAKNLARQAFERNPIETDALSILCIAAEADGSLDEAISARKQLAKLQPEQSEPWLELARLEWLSGNKDASRNHLACSLSLGRRDKQTLQKAAILCGEFKFPRLQLRLLQRASSLDENDPSIHKELALAAESNGNFELAQQAWLHIADLLPKDTYPLDHAAGALWKLDKRTAAIGLWEQATQIEPENALHFTALGRAYMQIGEIQRSLNCFGHALALQPNDPDFLVEAGSAMTCSGSPEEGLGALQKAVSLVPNDPIPLIALAETLHLLGRNTDARAALDRAAILAPLSAKGFALQAITSLEMGDLENAKETYNSVLKTEPADFQDVLWSTRSAIALADWDAAIHSIEEWMGTGNDKPEAELEYLRGQLRLQDLLWMYRSVCEAETHAPSQADLLGERKQYLQQMIDQFKSAGSNESIGELLQTWFELTTGAKTPDEWTVSQNIPQPILHEFTQAFALAQIRANRPAKAENALLQDNSTVNQDPYHSLLLGISQMMLGRFVDAQETLQQLQNNPMIRPLALFIKAQLWLKSDDNEKAITALNSALSDWPDEASWHAKLAFLYQENDKLEAALPHWQNAVELEPENGEYLTSLARIYRQAGQLTDAQATYAKSLQTSTVTPKVWKEAGEVALAIGDAEKAEAWFERACTLMPSDVGVMIGSSRAAMALGNVKLALNHARKAYRLAPNNVEVLTGLGDVFAQKGKLQKAIQIYDRALRVSEDDRAVQLARSKLLLRLGRTEEAAADLRTLTKADSEFEDAWAALSEAYTLCGNNDDALEAASKAAKLAPRNVEYQLLLGRKFKEAGQLDQALNVLTKASSLAPVDARIARELGDVHKARRQDTQALDAYLHAITLDPKEAAAYKQAGLILKVLKSYGQAADMFEKVVSINPLDPDALHQLAAVRALQLVHGGLEEQAVTL